MRGAILGAVIVALGCGGAGRGDASASGSASASASASESESASASASASEGPSGGTPGTTSATTSDDPSTGDDASTGSDPSSSGDPPDGSGIADDYPGDVGLGEHPSVVFFEDFEDADVQALVDGWDNASDPSAFTLDEDTPAGAPAGARSLTMTLADAGGVTLYENLPDQQDSVYVRYYVKYDAASRYHHAGMWLGGFNPPSDWPMGTAGIHPNGSDFFQNAFEPHDSATLIMDHYAQWPGMDCLAPDQCWGNVFLRGDEPTVQADAWTCIELMLVLNTPGESDGEYAVWIDDGLVQHLRPGSPSFDRDGVGAWHPADGGEPFPGFDWRSTSDLAFNWIWLDFYTDGGSRMQWDQVVVATERIGCMTPA